MKEYKFIYNNTEYKYYLVRKNIKHINIRISKDCNINVSAPYKVPFDFINSFVISKGEWIENNISDIKRIKNIKPDNNIYENKKVYFIGELYTINILKCKYNSIFCDYNNKIINICTYYNDNQKIKELYLKWLNDNGKIFFHKLTKEMIDLLNNEYNIKFPNIKIRNMKTRWGSCTPSKNSIRLNLQLMKADIKCIEQVILHELVHFIHFNHSKDFYNVMEKYMPDYKLIKERLEKNYKDGI